jgi:hypothetical protein
MKKVQVVVKESTPRTRRTLERPTTLHQYFTKTANPYWYFPANQANREHN